MAELVPKIMKSGVAIFSLSKRRTGSLKADITSADVQFPPQNQVKSKKRSSRTQMSKISAQNQVKSKKKKGHH